MVDICVHGDVVHPVRHHPLEDVRASTPTERRGSHASSLHPLCTPCHPRFSYLLDDSHPLGDSYHHRPSSLRFPCLLQSCEFTDCTCPSPPVLRCTHGIGHTGGGALCLSLRRIEVPSGVRRHPWGTVASFGSFSCCRACVRRGYCRCPSSICRKQTSSGWNSEEGVLG